MKKEWIAKYISGQATAEENACVEQWIKENAQHEREYLDTKNIWDMSGQWQDVPEVDIDAAWANFIRIRDERAGNNTSILRTLIRKSTWWNVAIAIGILGILSVWWLNNSLSEEFRLETSAYTQRSTLPDGSTVNLNKNTTLHYRKTWLGKEREVYLKRGEAFFDVKRDKSQPFVIESGKTRITVLGTSFHVRRDAEETEIIVASGSVKVNYANQEVVLKPEQMMVIPDTSKLRVKVDTVPDHLYRYYIHQEFVFENTPLSRVFDTLKKAYDIQFVIDAPEKGNLLLSATFEQQTLAEILDVIVQTFNLKVEKRGNKYHIK